LDVQGKLFLNSLKMAEVEQMSITNEQVVENIKPDIGLEQIQE
jgi:hypothetical protein